MSRIRFTTAQDVFEAFPSARDDIDVPPTEEPPLTFLKSLKDSDTPEDAVAFCAYLLPRREAVWWACQSVKALHTSRTSAENEALAAAEEWVREPEEERRQAALRLGYMSERSAPTTWLAFAAAWSGGSMTMGDDPPVPAAPNLTAKAVRAAVLTALARVPVKQRREKLDGCLAEGTRLANDGLTSDR
jgi:hypothetical protein